MVRLKSIGIKQTAKFFAVFCFLISLVFIIPISVITILVGSFSVKESGLFPVAFGGVFILVLPLFYALIGFVMVSIFSFIYNQIAKRIGGVEFEMEDKIKTES